VDWEWIGSGLGADWERTGPPIYLTLVSVDVVPIFSLLFGCGSNGDKANHSYLYQFASHVSQAAKLAIVVYAFDCMVLVLNLLGFAFHSCLPIPKDLPRFFTFAG
jgi:hypothetical protein